MAEPITIARPYAEAIFRLAREQSSVAEWSDSLALLEAVVRDEQIRALIGNPNVSRRELENLILGIAGGRISGDARNLVQVLVHNGRLELLSQVRDLYEGLRRDHEGVLEARIVSAFALTDDQLQELVRHVERHYQRKLNTEVEIDPDLIGGVKIAIGDKVIDATVRGRLDAMSAALTH